MASSYILKEEKIVRMTISLQSVITLDSTSQRLAAYGQNDIPGEDIIAFDDEAVRREGMRRDQMTTTNSARKAS